MCDSLLDGSKAVPAPRALRARADALVLPESVNARHCVAALVARNFDAIVKLNMSAELLRRMGAVDPAARPLLLCRVHDFTWVVDLHVLVDP
jgi:hypothetical protein